MATPIQPTFIPEPWANQGQYDTIPATNQQTGRASWDVGFPTDNAKPVSQGGIPPHYKDFQGVLNALSTFAWWQQRGGQFTWSADLEYPVGAFVLGSDGNLYKAIQASSPSDPKNPKTATAYWTIADPTAFLPLTGGTMKGAINGNVTGDLFTVYNLLSGQGLRLWGGNGFGDGASLYLYEKSNVSYPGEFSIYAKDSGNTAQLRGKPDGQLTWRSRDVEVVDSKGSGWIRYASGIQLCWGEEYSMATQVTVNYPKAFASNPMVIATSNYSTACGVAALSSSSFGAYLASYSGSPTYRWFAIGTWS